MAIRQVLPEDAHSIKAWAYDAYNHYVERMGKDPAPMMADFESQIEQGIVYVSSDDENNIQGFIVFYPKNDLVHLENIAVFAQYQGMGIGIGKNLITFCEHSARQNGHLIIELYTNVKMTENLDVYPYLGYQEFGRRNEDGFNRVFFRKELTHE